ncbi:hypothetical protein [Gemmiger sp.]
MKTIRNEYRDLKKENDLIFSTLAEYDRDTITDIIGTIDNSRGIQYEVELVRKDLIAMAAHAEAEDKPLTDVIGDTELFKRNLLANMPRPKFVDYMVDSLVWLGVFGLAVSATHLLLSGPWDCYYDAAWLVLCIVIMMPSAWLLQRIVPAEWAASTEKGVRYGVITAAMMGLWFVEFWFVDKWITPLLPAVGLPNVVAFVLFGAALAGLWTWRNRRRNELAEKRPWRDVIGQ